MEKSDSMLFNPCQLFNLPQPLENSVLYKIIENSHDGITVTDNNGTILLANTPAAAFMNKTIKDLVGYNVRLLIKKGFYSNSTILETIRTGNTVTGLITVASGKKVLSTSIPILNEDNAVDLVVTTTINQELFDTYVAAIEQERNKSEQYKSAANYLEGLEAKANEIVYKSPQMQSIVKEVSITAKTDSTILVSGESGTGKEVIARFIHRNSNRAREPFIPVNCAAIPKELIESEFFGYDKGAFSGANVKGKMGFFEMADKGTLFLDEIGEMPLLLQSKLLRVLESGEFQRVGGTKIGKTDARIISATNKDLSAMVDMKLFRKDLYYRLNVIPITLPPLRERPEDILELADKFLKEFNTKYDGRKFFSRNLIVNFINYHWPGNARELKNLIERLVIISSGNELNFSFDSGFNLYKEQTELQHESDVPNYMPLKDAVRTYEQKYIEKVVASCNGKISAAANVLGIHRTMIYRKLHNFSTQE